MQTHPTVSIAMCTYNGSKYIKQQLASIINQTYPISEIVICDDGSTDDTLEICRKFRDDANSNIQISIYQNNKTLGADANFVNTFKKTSSEVIAPSDQDDIWDTHKIEQLIAALTPDKDIAYCQEDNLLEETGTIQHEAWYVPTAKESIWKNRLRGHTCIFRRSLLSLYSFAEIMSWDYKLALYGILCDKIVGIDYIGGVWRRHCNAVSLYTPTKNDSSALQSTNIQLDTPNYGITSKQQVHIAKQLIKHSATHKLMPGYLASRITLIEKLASDKQLAIDKYTTRCLIKILNNVAKQTIPSMQKAGLWNILLYIHLEKLWRVLYKPKHLAARIRFAYRYPYLFWYSSKDTPWLC